MPINSQPFSRNDFRSLLNFIANNARARWPSPTYMMTSDAAWQMPGSDPKNNIRLWYDDDGLAGYAWFQPTSDLKFDIREGLTISGGIPAEMLTWAEQRRCEFKAGYPFYIDLDSMAEWAEKILSPPAPKDDEKHVLVATAFESDEPRIDFLDQNGFAPTKHFEPYLARSLDDPIPEPDLPPGMKLKHVEADDYEARVATHSASWAPASSFNMAQYLAVRAITEVYDPQLDLVAETEDGTFASYTIAWADPVSGVGSFEPFGTRPGWRGSGVSREVIYEGLRRLKATGMHSAVIYTAGFNHQAFRLYQSSGFKLIDKNRTFVKTL
jgi:GNAT superfamily N-acetyltransferase